MINKIKHQFKSNTLISIVVLADIIIIASLLVILMFKLNGNEDIKVVHEEKDNFKEMEFIDSEFEKVVKRALGKSKISKEDLKNVIRLSIKNNDKIKDISDLIYFENLKDLTIESCKVKDITVINHLTKLEKVDFSSNKIEQVPNVAELSNLVEVDLGDNKIKIISEEMELDNLQILIIEKNRIDNLDFLKSFPNLVKLDISSNNISDMTIVSLCENLEYLDFRYNSIDKYPNFERFENLHTVYVDEKYDRTQLDFLIGNFRNGDVITKKYLLEKQFSLK